MKRYPEIYKFDNRGKARVWFMEQDGSQHRTFDGLKEGKVKHSDWTQCIPTNVGRSNERDGVAQAEFEIEAAYKKKLSREYHETLESAGGGAHFFKPMLAETYKTFRPCYVQPKLDGIRCIARSTGFWSRTGKPLPGADFLFEMIRPLFERNPDLILDGELYNHEYKEDFEDILSAVRKTGVTPEEISLAQKVIQYHVYDIPSIQQNFSLRSKALYGIVKGSNSTGDKLQYVETTWCATEAEADALSDRYAEEMYEGTIHRQNSLYEQKRTKALEKRKEFEDAEFLISAILPGLGNWANKAKKVEIILEADHRDEKGNRQKAGIKGKMAFCAQLLETGMVDYKMVTVRFKGRTKYGMLRIPVATKWWTSTERDM